MRQPNGSRLSGTIEPLLQTFGDYYLSTDLALLQVPGLPMSVKSSSRYAPSHTHSVIKVTDTLPHALLKLPHKLSALPTVAQPLQTPQIQHADLVRAF